MTDSATDGTETDGNAKTVMSPNDAPEVSSVEAETGGSDDQAFPEPEPAGVHTLMPELKAALKEVIPKISPVIDKVLEAQKLEAKHWWLHTRIETVARYVLSGGIVVVVAVLGSNRILSGEAVIGILAALVGYLWGKSRTEESE